VLVKPDWDNVVSVDKDFHRLTGPAQVLKQVVADGSPSDIRFEEPEVVRQHNDVKETGIHDQELDNLGP
jgi:hypothetical protein